MVGRFGLQGYVSVAPELFHRTGPGFEGSYTDFSAVMPHMQALDDSSMQSDLRAAHAWLVRTRLRKTTYRRRRVLHWVVSPAFLAGLTLPLDAVVSYYGGGIAPGPRGPGLLGKAAEIACPLLFFWGGLDKHIGPDAVRAVDDALSAAEKDFVSVVIAQADHGFFCDARASYSAQAAALAWPTTLAFLNLHTS